MPIRVSEPLVLRVALNAKVDYLVTYNLKDFEGITGLNSAKPETILELLE